MSENGSSAHVARPDGPTAGSPRSTVVRALTVIVLLFTVMPWSGPGEPRTTVSAQGHAAWYSIEAIQSLATDELLADLARYRSLLLRDRSWARWPPDYWKQVADAAVNLRQVLLARGIRTPPIAIPAPGAGAGGAAAGAAAGAGGAGSGPVNPTLPGSGPMRRPGDTRLGSRSYPGRNARAGLTLAVILTAAQIAQCAADGKDVASCATAAAVQAVPGALAGATITVLSPTGAVVLTAGSGGAGIRSASVGSLERPR